MNNYKTYKQIKQSFSKERIEEIKSGADKIRQELSLLNRVRQIAGLTEEELVELLEAREDITTQTEVNDISTLGTIIRLIVAIGGSVDLTVNFPEKDPVQFSQIENLFFLGERENRGRKSYEKYEPT